MKDKILQKIIYFLPRYPSYTDNDFIERGLKVVLNEPSKQNYLTDEEIDWIMNEPSINKSFDCLQRYNEQKNKKVQALFLERVQDQLVKVNETMYLLSFQGVRFSFEFIISHKTENAKPQIKLSFYEKIKPQTFAFNVNNFHQKILQKVANQIEENQKQKEQREKASQDNNRSYKVAGDFFSSMRQIDVRPNFEALGLSLYLRTDKLPIEQKEELFKELTEVLGKYFKKVQ